MSSAGEAGARGRGRTRAIGGRPAHRQARRSSATCCSTSPAPARTTRRCARRRCAGACTSPSTACSTTPSAAPRTCASEAGGVRAAGPRLHRAGAAREPRRARGGTARRRRRAARADRARGHPRRSAQPHVASDGHNTIEEMALRRARARLRVPGDHRPLGEPRLRQRRLARAAAPPDRAGARGERAPGGHRAAGGQRGEHPARRLARLRGRAAGASSTG